MKSLMLCAALIVVLPTLTHAQTNRPPTRNFQPITSPEVRADRTVTFRVRASGATNVSVSGEWGTNSTGFTPDERGIWTATIGPLDPGLYGYGFSVDGFRALDPANSGVKPSRTPVTSILDVPGDHPLPSDFLAVPHGIVRLHDYESKSLGKHRAFRVYTPPDYDKHRNTRFPVLYLLHGTGDNEAVWTTFGHAHWIADNLVAQHLAKSMVIVMPDGHAFITPPGATNIDSRNRNIEAFERDLLEDVMPIVESTYRVQADRKHRAIIGLSMGGVQSLSIGLKHLELFAWVGGMSSAVNTESVMTELSKDPKGVNKKLDLLWFACGSSDGLVRNNRQLDEALAKNGITHEFHETDGNHSWPVWRRYLVDFLPRVFASK